MLYAHDHQLLESFTQTTAVFSKRHNHLMERIQARDEQALVELMEAERRLIGSIVQQIVNCATEVDDVLQDVFLDVWNKAAQFDSSKGNGMSWVVTIARRRAIDRVRRRNAYGRMEERLIIATENEPQETAWDTVESSADESEKSRMFSAVFSKIPKEQAEVVRLAYLGGFSQREIAKQLNLPLGTVKTRLELGLRKVRNGVLAVADKQEWLCAA